MKTRMWINFIGLALLLLTFPALHTMRTAVHSERVIHEFHLLYLYLAARPAKIVLMISFRPLTIRKVNTVFSRLPSTLRTKSTIKE